MFGDEVFVDVEVDVLLHGPLLTPVLDKETSIDEKHSENSEIHQKKKKKLHGKRKKKKLRTKNLEEENIA